MAGEASLGAKAKTLINNVRYNWKEPPVGKYMNYKEIFAYSFGGIGASMIIAMVSQLIVQTTNMVVGGAIGIAPTDMYVMYVIATLANIPLTAVRANMIDNSRGKGGKYRPYLMSMGIPTVIIALAYVYFPYDLIRETFATGQIFNRDKSYVIVCAIVLFFNLLLQFFWKFFQDAYTNLVHVLSPNTNERTNVLAIKAVVYSLGPSILNIVYPLIAKFATDNNLYNLKVYRIAYPPLAFIAIMLTAYTYANTTEKIIQAKTHAIQISFWDAFKEVAKNKYFWIISLAGWLGFLEGSYGTIIGWAYNYGHACDGGTFALITTLYSNASLWGMLLAPFCVNRFGKKKVIIFVNLLNVVFILAMGVNPLNIWWLFICIYLNYFVGAFEQITTPAIQADIRDYQQYKSGERIDGSFSAVQTIGDVITLLTSAILPAVQSAYGIFQGNGYEKPYDILDVTTGEPGLLHKMIMALVLMAALGAFLNVIPYFFYDFTEKKQRSVARVLKVRALFEDYGNNALNDHQIVEAIDLVRNAREMAKASEKDLSVKHGPTKEEKPKKDYKKISDKELQAAAKLEYKTAMADYKAQCKAGKKQHREDITFNEEIEIAKFVCAELDKFENPIYIHQVQVYTEIAAKGLDYMKSVDLKEAKEMLKNAKALPKSNEQEKEIRKFDIQLAKIIISAKKRYIQYYESASGNIEEPDMTLLTSNFDKQDETEFKLNELVKELTVAQKEKDEEETERLKTQIKELKENLKNLEKESKTIMDDFAKFNRAFKPCNDAKKVLLQAENYKHFDEIAALYDEAKENAAREDAEKAAEIEAKLKEEQEELERRKAEKQAKKNLKESEKKAKKNASDSEKKTAKK